MMDRARLTATRSPALAILIGVLAGAPGLMSAGHVEAAQSTESDPVATASDDLAADTAPADSTQKAPSQTQESSSPGAGPKLESPAYASSRDQTPESGITGSRALASASSWFDRPALKLVVDEGEAQWSVTLFGFIEADFIHDSTRSYGDAIGGSLVARKETYAGRVGRTQFSMRNTRIGLRLESPKIGSVKPSALFEGDFFGNPPSHAARESESIHYDSSMFRARQAYLEIKSPYLDVLAGQTYDLFGWQNTFFPCSAEFLGLPNQVFHRSVQFRLSHTLNLGTLGVDLAVAALRPAQRDSELPDANAGVRLSVESWKGIATPGNVGTRAIPLSIGVSAVVRQFRVNAFTPPPAQSSNRTSGWGISVDGLIPVLPALEDHDRGNKLTLVGGFVTGTGIADLITAGGGATFPTLPNPALANPPPIYTANIDDGLVAFDTVGVLHTIDWQAFRAGVQYYLPPSGRLFVSLNYTHAYSKNMSALYPRGGAEIELLTRVAQRSQYVDANLFWDATPAVRFGASFQYTTVEYLDLEKPNNQRGMAQALYVF